MDSPTGVNRVILVVLDGLRADAIPLFGLPHLAALGAAGCSTFAADTVRPSVTAAAMTSLFTGVRPFVHGVRSDRFGLPRASAALTPLPGLLRDHGVPTRAFIHAIPRAYRGLLAHAASRLGAQVTTEGDGAAGILAAALPTIAAEQHGLHFLHWPDADRAGHAHGWMSREYQRAARDMDDAVGRLVEESGVLHDRSTVLIALADHGGGGAVARDHDSNHPLDTTIPIIVAGGQIAAGELAPGTSLLDVPATIAWLLGVPRPVSYSGRPLTEALAPDMHGVVNVMALPVAA